ncbi:MAG: AsmA family protein [Marinifilaceae bacterium]|jgi:hypothetical protein|nr:AsmA family protein [Marinifilaceae bacterium]
MKKILKLTGLILASIIIILLIVPHFFKSKIIEISKKELNKNIEGSFEIEDVSISFFTDFPNLNISLDDVKLTTEIDSIAKIEAISASISLPSLISDDIEIEEILIDNSFLFLVLNEKGELNINKTEKAESRDNTKQIEQDSSKQIDVDADSKRIHIEKVSIRNSGLRFRNEINKSELNLADLDIDLKGDFSSDSTKLDLNANISDLSYYYQDKYLGNKINLQLDLQLDADLKNKKFTIIDNKLKINNIEFGIDGFFKFEQNDNSILSDIKLYTKSTKFKSVLALLPPSFDEFRNKVKTDGVFTLKAFSKGIYKENEFPNFGLELIVKDSKIKHNLISDTIKNINIALELKHPQGALDSLKLNLNQFHFSVADNPFDINLSLKNIFSDIYLEGACKGIVNLSNLNKIIPVDSVSAEGIIKSDIRIKGRKSYIDNGKYDDFIAQGSLGFNNVKLHSGKLKREFRIDDSEILISSKKINLKRLLVKIGESDFKLFGYVNNHLAYLLNNKKLGGNFRLESQYVNVNQLMPNKTKSIELKGENNNTKDNKVDQKKNKELNSKLSAIKIPENLNIKFSTDIKHMKFDDLNMSDIKGMALINNGILILQNLSAKMLNGSMITNGSYNSRNIKFPKIKCVNKISGFDINEAYKSLSILRKVVPVAADCKGKISSNLDINSYLTSDMKINLKTLNGSGKVKSKQITITNNKSLNDLAKVLDDDKYKEMSISDIDFEFTVTDGNIVLKPFQLKLAGNPAKIYGNQSVEGIMDFTIEMKIPKSDLGGGITKYIDLIPGSDKIKVLDIDVRITGHMDKPKLKLDMSKAIRQAKKALENNLKKNGLKDLEKKGRDLLKELFK